MLFNMEQFLAPLCSMLFNIEQFLATFFNLKTFLTAIPCSMLRLGTSQMQCLAPFRVWELPRCNSLQRFVSGNFLAFPFGGWFLSFFMFSNLGLAFARSILHKPFKGLLLHYCGTSLLFCLLKFRRHNVATACHPLKSKAEGCKKTGHL